MIIQNNAIKAHLRNVYFVAGLPCSGKSAVSRALGSKYHVPVYDIDVQYGIHQRMSDPRFQPAMNRRFRNADEFFGRSIEEYTDWLVANTREQFDFILPDLIKLSSDTPVLCDCHLTPEEAEQFTDPSRVIFLLRDPTDIADEYMSRPDHQDFSRYIHSASDFEQAKRTVNETLYRLNAPRYESIKAGNYFWLERDDSRSIEETAELAARHFGWKSLPDLRVEQVEKGTELAEKLLLFVEDCSWLEARDHIAKCIREWLFTDWETMFAATVNGEIVGMTGVGKTDYYPDRDIFPWVSSIFVAEEYRGQRISGKLIDRANEYLRGLGFKRSYIPTDHLGLYEHYGYSYVRDIVNYGGTTDMLYVKRLK